MHQEPIRKLTTHLLRCLGWVRDNALETQADPLVLNAFQLQCRCFQSLLFEDLLEGWEAALGVSHV